MHPTPGDKFVAYTWVKLYKILIPIHKVSGVDVKESYVRSYMLHCIALFVWALTIYPVNFVQFNTGVVEREYYHLYPVCTGFTAGKEIDRSKWIYYAVLYGSLPQGKTLLCIKIRLVLCMVDVLSNDMAKWWVAVSRVSRMTIIWPWLAHGRDSATSLGTL